MAYVRLSTVANHESHDHTWNNHYSEATDSSLIDQKFQERSQ